MKAMKKAIHDKYKSKAMKYINSNKKYTNIYSDVDINKIGDDCKTLFSNYDDFLIQSNSKYNKLKGASSEFLNGYWELKKRKDKEKEQIKDKKLMSPFLDLINEYTDKGYKVSNIDNTEKNIFKPSILIEENNKYLEYFKIHKISKKEKKELHYLKKVKYCVKKEEEKIAIQKKKLRNLENEQMNEISDSTKRRELSSDSLPYSHLSYKSPKKMNLTQGNFKKNLFKEEQELTKYNNNIKTLINNEEEERIKRKAHLNKEGLIFSSTLTGKSLKYKKFTFRKNNNNEQLKQNNNNNISYSLRNKNNSLKNKKTVIIKSQKNTSSYINFVRDSIKSKSRIHIKNNTNKESDLPELRKNYFHSRNKTLSTSLNEQGTKDSFMLNSNGEIKDFLKVISKTKNKISNNNFDRIKKIVLTRNSINNNNNKILNEIRKLDKKILHLDKDLIKAIEESKTISQ